MHFSGTNLLTRCQSASSLFSAVFGFKTILKEIFLELEIKDPEIIFGKGTFQKTEDMTKWTTEKPPPPRGMASMGPA